MIQLFASQKIFVSRAFAALALGVFLTACGGGNGGGSSQSAPPTTSQSSSTSVAASEVSSSPDESSSSSEVFKSSSSTSQSSQTSTSQQSSSSSNSSENSIASSASSSKGGSGVIRSASSQDSSSSSSSEGSSSSSSSEGSSSSSSSESSSSSSSSEGSSSSSSSESSSSSSSSESSSSSSSSESSSSSSSSESSSSSSSSESSSSSSSSSEAAVPTVDAGPAQTVVTGTSVSFVPTASADKDQKLVTYLWEQVDDTNIATTIIDADKLKASLSAPYVSAPKTLKFKLTVTDGQGKSASDTVTVTVNPDPSAPSVQITFPPPESIYHPDENSNTLSMFGDLETQGAATITTITIKGVTPEVRATVNGQQWRADNVKIPSGISDITLIVKAEDSQGRVSDKSVHLTVSDDSDPDYGNDVRAILWDGLLDKLWVLKVGSFTSDTEIIPVNPRTGDSGKSIISAPLAASRMIFNASKSAFLVSGAISGKPGTISSVDKTTGVITVLSGEEKGSGPDLQTGSAGLAVDGTTLYEAENTYNDFSGLVKINLNNGNREVLLDGKDEGSLAYALADIVYYSGEVFMLKNGLYNSSVLGYNLGTQVDRTLNSSASGIDGEGKLVVANDNIAAISTNAALKGIEISNGAVSTISIGLVRTVGSNEKFITYDPDNKLYYSSQKYQIISVVDELSGHVVDLSEE